MMAEIKADISTSASTDIAANTETKWERQCSGQWAIPAATSEAATDGLHDRSSAILYTDFVVGQSMGEYSLNYDEMFVRGWQHVFGQATLSRAQGAGVSLMLMMRAFLTVVSPRPPGNIHARQSLSFSSLPVLGDHITVSVVCESKTIRKDRRYVELGVKAHNQRGQQVFTGVLSLIWVA